MELTDFLLARIAEDEEAARAAIDPERPGSHWHWVMDHNDTPVAHGHLQAAQDDGESVSLRTVEEYPSGVGPLPHFVVQFGEVHGGGGEHIARWDPARVLAECESKRRIVAEHERGQYLSSYYCECCCTTSEATGEPHGEWPCLTLRALALPYASHPDYDPTWAA
jgi:hypothetical protein